jgi:rhodanese-related sulfurtransferase
MKAEGGKQKDEGRRMKAEVTARNKARFGGALLPSAFCLLLFLLPSCRTVGISKTSGGYSEIAPTIAAEMILDSQQVVVIDIRSSDSYRGPEGHIAGAISAPFDTIEMHLPELLPYQNQTVLVYGETSTDGAVAAQLLSVAGFRNVVHVSGGIKEWIERGYRTVHAQ